MPDVFISNRKKVGIAQKRRNLHRQENKEYWPGVLRNDNGFDDGNNNSDDHHDAPTASRAPKSALMTETASLDFKFDDDHEDDDDMGGQQQETSRISNAAAAAGLNQKRPNPEVCAGSGDNGEARLSHKRPRAQEEDVPVAAMAMEVDKLTLKLKHAFEEVERFKRLHQEGQKRNEYLEAGKEKAEKQCEGQALALVHLQKHSSKLEVELSALKAQVAEGDTKTETLQHCLKQVQNATTKQVKNLTYDLKLLEGRNSMLVASNEKKSIAIRVLQEEKKSLCERYDNIIGEQFQKLQESRTANAKKDKKIEHQRAQITSLKDSIGRLGGDLPVIGCERSVSGNAGTGTLATAAATAITATAVPASSTPAVDGILSTPPPGEATEPFDSGKEPTGAKETQTAMCNRDISMDKQGSQASSSGWLGSLFGRSPKA